MMTATHHILERLVAAWLLFLLGPLFVVLAILLLIIQGRPVFFLQRRAGLGGKTFTMHKFRTMDSDAYDRPHAERVTRIGRVLRRVGFDELPQVLNIVRGEMSFVGPRPALPYQVERYGDHERRRLAVRPGITGWAQIHGRNAISWRQRIDLDIWYIQNRNIFLDIRIIWKTLLIVLSGRGVYGSDGVNPDYRLADLPIREAA